jgi:esterase/lipase
VFVSAFLSIFKTSKFIKIYFKLKSAEKISKVADKPIKSSDSLKIPKVILLTCHILEFISPTLAARFAAKLFTTPLKYKLPNREVQMDLHSRQETLHIRSIKKDVVVYNYGDGQRKILLVHGWSGRGTQLVKFADAFVKAGFSTVSFDAPAHGKSSGKTTLMPEFVAVILQLQSEVGPFYSAIGHSLGGMSLLNAIKRGLAVRNVVIIGSGDVIQDIIDDFMDKLQLNRKTGMLMRKHFEKSGESMDSYSSYVAAKEVAIPALVIHDEGDDEVPAACALHIKEHLKYGELMLTNGLGHRKILGSQHVISKTLDFVINQAK